MIPSQSSCSSKEERVTVPQLNSLLPEFRRPTLLKRSSSLGNILGYRFSIERSDDERAAHIFGESMRRRYTYQEYIEGAIGKAKLYINCRKKIQQAFNLYCSFFENVRGGNGLKKDVVFRDFEKAKGNYLGNAFFVNEFCKKADHNILTNCIQELPCAEIHSHIDGAIRTKILLEQASAMGLFCTAFCGINPVRGENIKYASKFIFYKAGDPRGEINVYSMLNERDKYVHENNKLEELISNVKGSKAFFNAFDTLESIAEHLTLGNKLIYQLSDMSENITYLEQSYWPQREKLPERYEKGEEGLDFGNPTFSFEQAYQTLIGSRKEITEESVKLLIALLRRSGWIKNYIDVVKKDIDGCRLSTIENQCKEEIYATDIEINNCFSKITNLKEAANRNYTSDTVMEWWSEFKESNNVSEIYTSIKLKKVEKKLRRVEEEGEISEIVDAIKGHFFWTKRRFLIEKREILRDKLERIQGLIQQGYDENDLFSINNPTVVRLIIDNDRSLESNAEIFASLAASMELCQLFNQVVGIGFAGMEYTNRVTRNFKKHMEMIAALRRLYPKVKVTIHAGELNETLAGEKLPLANHIEWAVKIAGANRVGHGTCIKYTNNLIDFLKFLGSQGVHVEICLTSNECILGVVNGNHPIILFIKHGVPFSFCTDDQGVFNTSLPGEILKGLETYSSLNYLMIKESVINSIRNSFIPGESIYEEGSKIRLKRVFRGVDPSLDSVERLVRSCLGKDGWENNPCDILTDSQKAFIFSSEKAQLEFRLMKAFAIYEDITIPKIAGAIP